MDEPTENGYDPSVDPRWLAEEIEVVDYSTEILELQKKIGDIDETLTVFQVPAWKLVEADIKESATLRLQRLSSLHDTPDLGVVRYLQGLLDEAEYLVKLPETLRMERAQHMHRIAEIQHTLEEAEEVIHGG